MQQIIIRYDLSTPVFMSSRSAMIKSNLDISHLLQCYYISMQWFRITLCTKTKAGRKLVLLTGLSLKMSK